MDAFLGSWQGDNTKGENLKAIGDAEGIPEDKRQHLKDAIRSIQKNGDGTYTFGFKAGPVDKTNVVKLGEPFEFQRPDGQKVKVTMTLEGNAWVENIVGKDKTVIIKNVREGEYTVSNFTIGSLTGKRYWKKV